MKTPLSNPLKAMTSFSGSSKTVVVGMSGGVDSSVSALLLKLQGYRVIGMFMKNWEEKDENGICNASKEYEDVVAVCEQIGIPCYSINFVQEYKETVFQYFLQEFEKGHTPNPDILCNREIKFKVLFEKALELGADFLATGHYCQIASQNDTPLLLKGEDDGKDQSYFLHAVKASVFEKVLFPIGGMLKKEVRAIAQRHRLATAEKKDSTGICFIGKRNFKAFLSQHLPFQPGNFENMEGKVVGRHDGVAYYTIGQRRGLAIGGAGEAWYVVGKDIARNVVFVDQGASHPALFADTLTAVDLTWIGNDVPTGFPFYCKSKIRYRQQDQECVIEGIENSQVFVRFLRPQRAITPRQSIVFYEGDRCLGGAVIDAAGPSYFAQKLLLPYELV